MSTDDRIRQLSDLFIEDLRGPMEKALGQLLADLMEIAAKDQAAAVEQALARAADERQAAVAAATDELKKSHEEALVATRAELTHNYDQVLAATMREATEEHDRQLASLRDELLQNHEAVIAAMTDQASIERDAALQVARFDISREHDAALASVREQLTGEHEAAIAGLREQLLGEHQAALATAREELQGQHDCALVVLKAQLERDHQQVLDAARDAATGEQAAEHAESAALVTVLQQERDAARATAAEHAEAAAQLADLQQERDAARRSVAELTDQLAAARAQFEQMTQIAHAESEASEQASAGEVDARVAERQSELACTERVLTAMRRLDDARALSDVFTILADETAAGGVRAALALVQGTRIRGWRLAGMGEATAAMVDAPLDHAGILGLAVEMQTTVSTDDAKDAPADGLPAFLVAPPDRTGLALPIVVGGRVVAVLYADNGSGDAPVVPSNWPEVVEVLARHAGRCLEVLTLSRASTVAARPVELRPAAPRPVPQAAPAVESDEAAREEESARRHARLLISEIKLYNEELVERGRREGNLIALLGSEIEKARRLYEEKIPATVRQRVDCFDEEIVRTLAGGDRALLGQVT
jgi:hypothetical protein